MRTVHEKRRDHAMVHACSHCAAAFGTADKLTKHVRTVHEKRRDHACLHCAAAFLNRSTNVAQEPWRRAGKLKITYQVSMSAGAVSLCSLATAPRMAARTLSQGA